jgi:hypothetical protein
VLITSVGNGRNSQGNLRNVGGAGGRNTAARNVRRAHGCSIGIGVLQLRNDWRVGRGTRCLQCIGKVLRRNEECASRAERLLVHGDRQRRISLIIM